MFLNHFCNNDKIQSHQSVNIRFTFEMKREREKKPILHLTSILTSLFVFFVCVRWSAPGSSPVCREKPCHYCGNPAELDNASRFYRSLPGSPGHKRLWLDERLRDCGKREVRLFTDYIKDRSNVHTSPANVVGACIV